MQLLKLFHQKEYCILLLLSAGNQLKHQELHASYINSLSTVMSILQDIEDIDDIGEEVLVEINEEIAAGNPTMKDDVTTTSAAPSMSFELSRQYVRLHLLQRQY